VTARRKTVEAPRSEAPLYIAKAVQFVEEASAAIESSRNDAAMLNAVHAAITAADAICVAIAGRRSADPDHQRAADLLQEIGGGSQGISGHVRQLRMLLAKKNVVEYESRQAKAKEASEAVQRAERFVDWAKQIVEAARL
jgi:HEPN domain-containing protein